MSLSFQRLATLFTLLTSLTLPVSAPVSAAASDVETISACVDRVLSKMPRTQDIREAMWDAANLCQTLITAQRTGDLQQIRADNFVFQRSENSVLMWMVVAITIAGVALAAAQLWASYVLARVRGSALSEGGSVDFSKDKLAVQSSVVGVVVLGISFAFFLVFVLWVYTFDDTSRQKNVVSQSADEPPHQISAGGLRPMPESQSAPK
jgi:hypothetical protein